MTDKKNQLLDKIRLTSEHSSILQSPRNIKAPRYSFNPAEKPYRNPINHKISKAIKKSKDPDGREIHLCPKCRLFYKQSMIKLQSQVLVLRTEYEKLKKYLARQRKSILDFSTDLKKKTSRDMEETISMVIMEMEQKNFRLEIQNFYQQEQIKQLKTILHKIKTVHQRQKESSSSKGKQQESQKFDDFIEREKTTLQSWQKQKKQKTEINLEKGLLKYKKSKQKEVQQKKNSSIEDKIQSLQNYVEKGIVLMKGQQLSNIK